MTNQKTNIVFRIGLPLIIAEIVLIIISVVIVFRLYDITSAYQPSTYGQGMFELFQIIIVIFLLVLMVIMFAIRPITRTNKRISIIIFAWILIMISSVISLPLIFANTRHIISELQFVKRINEIPDYHYCFGNEIYELDLGPYSITTEGLISDKSKLLVFSKKPTINNSDTIDDVIEEDKVYGIKDTNDSIIIEPIYHEIFFNHYRDIARTVIRKNTKEYHGYIDANGKVIFPNTLDLGNSFINGYAKVVKGGKMGIINTKGEFIIKPLYDCIREYRNGVAIIYEGDLKNEEIEKSLYSAVNSNNKTIIKPINRRLSFVSDNVIMEKKMTDEKSIRLFDIKGRLIRDKHETSCSEFKYGMAFTSHYHSGKRTSYLIDIKGETLLECPDCNFDEAFKIYVVNTIISNYSIIQYDSTESSTRYSIKKRPFLEEPVKRKTKLQGFNYIEILTEIHEKKWRYGNNYYYNANYLAYVQYFSSMNFLPNKFEREFPDSTMIEVQNDSLHFMLTYYTENDSLKYTKL